MYPNSASRKTRKILKPFVKDQNMLDRLQNYIAHQDLQPTVSSHSPGSKRPSRKQKRKHFRDSVEHPQVFQECKESNPDVSDHNAEDNLKSENFANLSLRSVYLKNVNNSPATPASSPKVPVIQHSDIYEKQTLSKQDDGSRADMDRLKEQVLSTYAGKKSEEKSVEASVKKDSEKCSTAKKKKIIDSSLQHSNVKFSDIGGLSSTLVAICKLLLHLMHPFIFKKIGIKHPPRGFLLHGPSGCGKTLLAHAIAGELGLPFIEVAATELVSGISGESEAKIRELFTNAISCAPCILFIDEIDAITPKREFAQKEMEKRIVTQLLKCMDELHVKDASAQVMVIGATNRLHSIDPALRRAGRFDSEISIKIPDEDARLQILKIVCKELRLSADFDLHWLASITPGFVGADLVSLTALAAKAAVERFLETSFYEKFGQESEGFNDMFISWLKDKPPLQDEQLESVAVEADDFHTALADYVPSSKREGFVTIPNITWKDVGALENVKEELQEAILWPVRYKREFQIFNVPVPTGVLLCGPKGCGKTLLAKAVANECSINFLSVKGPELLNMYVGESERAVRECFQRAKNSSPCVIFFDEIDALCPSRSGNNDNAATDRVVNQLLTEIDGIEGRKQIFVMGATNRPENIDSAMLRPGRLERTIFVGVPNEIDRYDILRTITHDGSRPKLSKDVCLEALAKDDRCDGFSGADLTSLVGKASRLAFKDYVSALKTGQKFDFEIKLNHFELAFDYVSPSISDKDKLFFKQMRGTLSKKKPSLDRIVKGILNLAKIQQPENSFENLQNAGTS